MLYGRANPLHLKGSADDFLMRRVWAFDSPPRFETLGLFGVNGPDTRRVLRGVWLYGKAARGHYSGSGNTFAGSNPAAATSHFPCF
jgi:hypothetical protein